MLSSFSLVVGDVESGFDLLFSRVGRVQSSKAGPFDALLVVGGANVFGREGSQHLKPYIAGEKQVPLPTYFICGDEVDTSLVDALPSGGSLCKNLTYLGRAGVQTLQLPSSPCGADDAAAAAAAADGKPARTLTVAYLSGHYDPSSYFSASGGERNVKYQAHYVESDVIALMNAGLAAPHIDVLLTAEWAKGWQMLLAADKVPAALVGSPHVSVSGSPVVAKLASQLPARYHFAGCMDAYLELPPYRNRQFVTRFFGLAKLQSARKEKNLYACNVAPFASLDLSAVPADTTPCPYTVGSKPMAQMAGATGAAHPFPSSYDGGDADGSSSAKRQRLGPPSSVPAGVGMGALPQHPHPSQQGQRFDSGFMNSMAAYDQATMNSAASMRWDFKKPQRGPPPPNYVCRVCNEPGHWIDDCPVRAKQHAERGGDGVPHALPPDYVCRKCNQPGHHIRHCPIVQAEEAGREHKLPYVCRKCNQPGHPIQQCPLIQAEVAAGHSEAPPPPTYVCKKCNAAGAHYVRLCPLVLAENQARAAMAATSGVPVDKMPPVDYVCKVCNIPGHWIRDCPVVRKENEERARLAAAAGGAAGVGLLGAGPVASGNLDANGMPLGTKQDCWFCLATEHVSTHLILSVGSETYLALAKGCLNDEHVLILPIVHVSSSLDLTAEQRSEVDRYKLALRKYYRSKGLECVMYERFIPTRAAQHMHIQIIPLTREQALLARKTLLEEARKLDASLAFQPIHPMQTLEQANPNRLPFILFELPVLSGDPQQQQHAAAAASAIPASVGSVAFAPFPVERLIHYVAPGGHKVMGLFDFPRAVVATMIGRPERSDWKKVGHTEEQETELVENMKDKFVNFDFTVGEVDASTAPVQ